MSLGFRLLGQESQAAREAGLTDGFHGGLGLHGREINAAQGRHEFLGFLAFAAEVDVRDILAGRAFDNARDGAWATDNADLREGGGFGGGCHNDGSFF